MLYSAATIPIDRYKILLNSLAAYAGVLLTVTLFQIDTISGDGCRGVSIFGLFCVLAYFNWLMIEAAHLKDTFVTVFQRQPDGYAPRFTAYVLIKVAKNSQACGNIGAASVCCVHVCPFYTSHERLYK